MENETFSRHSIRLKNHDYSQPGGYFLSLVTFRREHLFGEVADGKMHLNDAGMIVRETWWKLQERFHDVKLDEMQIMPNHFHGIVFIKEAASQQASVAAIHELPLQMRLLQLPHPDQYKNESLEEYRLRRRRMLIPKLVGYFKMNTAKLINLLLDSTGVPVWQRNYYEHIIRTDDELARIRKYIISNPQKWDQDEENR